MKTTHIPYSGAELDDISKKNMAIFCLHSISFVVDILLHKCTNVQVLACCCHVISCMVDLMLYICCSLFPCSKIYKSIDDQLLVEPFCTLLDLMIFTRRVGWKNCCAVLVYFKVVIFSLSFHFVSYYFSY